MTETPVAYFGSIPITDTAAPGSADLARLRALITDIVIPF
jgi:hypothetical protein